MTTSSNQSVGQGKVGSPTEAVLACEGGHFGSVEDSSRIQEFAMESSAPPKSSMSSNLAGSTAFIEDIYELDTTTAEASNSTADTPPADTPPADTPPADTLPANTLPAATSFEEEFFENDLGLDDGLEDYDDEDSALGSSIGDENSTFSVASSVYNFVEENGHTYHRYKDGKYVLPNDEAERERMDMQHHLWSLTLHGKLHLAPLDKLNNLNRALDIGTGTGIWAIDFANNYPTADVTGTDLSPIQPVFVPPNCHFEIDDAEDEWIYTNPFSYIHFRNLHTCFKSYSTVIKSAYRHLSPGGYLEVQDQLASFRAIDNSLQGSNIVHWIHLLHEGSIKLGLNWNNANWMYRKFFEDAGFVDVKETMFQWPINGWAKGKRNKVLGEWFNQMLVSGLHGISAALLSRGLGMTAPEIEVLLAGVRKDMCNKDIHAYLPIVVIYGRKPQ